jgi:hypothetical protein
VEVASRVAAKSTSLRLAGEATYFSIGPVGPRSPNFDHLAARLCCNVAGGHFSYVEKCIYAFSCPVGAGM